MPGEPRRIGGLIDRWSGQVCRHVQNFIQREEIIQGIGFFIVADHLHNAARHAFSASGRVDATVRSDGEGPASVRIGMGGEGIPFGGGTAARGGGGRGCTGTPASHWAQYTQGGYCTHAALEELSSFKGGVHKTYETHWTYRSYSASQVIFTPALLPVAPPPANLPFVKRPLP